MIVDNSVRLVLSVVQDLPADRAIRLLHRAEELLNACWLEEELHPEAARPELLNLWEDEFEHNPTLAHLLNEILETEPHTGAAVAITRVAIAERLKDWKAVTHRQ